MNVIERRRRQRAMGGTFIAAVAMALQLGQSGSLADDNLILTGPVVFLGALLSGWVLRPSAAFAMAAASVSGLATLAIWQTGSSHTDELLLLAIPFSAYAAVIVGHCRNWAGKTAILVAAVVTALAIGIGMTEFPMVFAVAHLAAIISLPNLPLR